MPHQQQVVVNGGSWWMCWSAVAELQRWAAGGHLPLMVHVEVTVYASRRRFKLNIFIPIILFARCTDVPDPGSLIAAQMWTDGDVASMARFA